MLEIKGLDIFFNSQQIVHNLNLNVKENQFVSLIGESGSGKSITALSITKLLPKHARMKGTVLFEQKNIFNTTKDELRKIRTEDIAYIFQEPLSALNPIMRIEKQLLENAKIQSVNKDKKLKKILNQVGLFEHKRIRRSYPHQLSGGQRQRVMIAMALIREPKLLIADEPSTALDPILKNEILTLLKSIQKKNRISILFISHELRLVLKNSDMIYVLQNGCLVDKFTPSSNKKTLHPYTQELLDISTKIKNGLVDAEEDILEFKDVYFQYSSKKGIGPIGFHLKKGEILGIIGESGSGKSTLVSCLLKLKKIQRGNIHFEGIDIKEISNKKQYAKNIQMVFQDPNSSLNPNHSVLKIILEVLQIHHPKKANPEHVFYLLDQVELDQNSATKYPHQLSGGQKQRVSIARALAVSPKLLVLDEAVSALDAKTQIQILTLLKKIQISQGLTYLFIGHDMKVIRNFCDRAIILQNGKIVEWGSISNIFEKPSKDYTKQLIGTT